MKTYTTPELFVHGDIATLTLEEDPEIAEKDCTKELPPGKIRDFDADAFCARSKS